MKFAHVAALACALGLSSGLTRAEDWSMYHGPNSNGISTETANLKWSATPKIDWKVPTVNGFSSFAVGGGKCFTLVGRKVENTPMEVCIALDAASGKELWAQNIEGYKYQGGGDSGAPGNNGGDGPRSTPSFSDGVVYAYSGELKLAAMDATSGKIGWMHDIKKEFAGRNIAWSNASSPVIEGELVIVTGGGPGESYLAFNKKTGQLAWKTGDDVMTHSTPTLATILGQRQIIFFVKSGLVSLDPKDGKTLWKYAFPYSTSTAISPVVSGDDVYCSAGYGIGGGACKISKDANGFKATELWKIPGNEKVANHWSTPVCKDGFLYGMFSFKNYASGPMKCVELATGKIMWEKPGFGAGNVILVGDQVLALTDDGTLVTVEANSTGYKEVGRAKVIDGKCWSTPALSNGKVYVRSTKEAACVEAPK